MCKALQCQSLIIDASNRYRAWLAEAHKGCWGWKSGAADSPVCCETASSCLSLNVSTIFRHAPCYSSHPFKYICFLLTYWLNGNYCFHLSQQKWLTCGDTAALLLMSLDCKVNPGYHENTICCPFFCLTLFINPLLLLGQLLLYILSGAVHWEKIICACEDFN